MPYFQRPASLWRPIGFDDARAAASILTEPEPTAADVARFDQMMAGAYGADPALPGAFTEPAAEHGGRPVLMALGYSYFLSGHGPRDIPEAIEDSGACEGTGRLVPPIPVDDLVPDAPRTASVTDDPVVAEPAMVEDEQLGQVAPPMGGSPAAGPVSDDQVEIGSKITDQNGETWQFAWMPWVGVIDEKGKAQKVPARKEWQLTLPGEWQVPDKNVDRTTPNDDPNTYGPGTIRTRPGTGKWRPDWEAGWVCNQRTGLWVVDVDDLNAFWRRMEILGIGQPKTRAQSTGRAGGGMHLLFDGRDLPEQYWRQGGLGNPVWGDLKANGYIAAQGAHHPLGPVYDWIPESPAELIKPPLEFADVIMAARALWKETLKDQGKSGGKSGATGRAYVPSMNSENRNNRLCSLRGTLFNKGYDDGEIREMLLAANEEFDEPQTLAYLESTVLKPKPDWARHRGRKELPDPLTDLETPWLRRDVKESFTGLDDEGKVQLNADKDADNDPGDVLRLGWAIALGLVSPHIATLDGVLVVVSGAENGSLNIGELTPRRLRLLCAENNVCWEWHEGKDEDTEGERVLVLPSIQMCATALSGPAIKLYRPVLSGITKVPVLRPEPDRTLLERQGVDESTKRVYWPDLPIGTIPAKPTRSEVAAAKKLILDELLHDFPWTSYADKANCLAMWLTSYLQPFGQYLSPLFVLNASKASSGKSFLVTVMVETTGAYFRTWVNLEEEIRKSLTACLMENDPVIILDDVGKKDTVSSATLSSALTKSQWDDRVLGVSKNFRGTNNRTWVLAGNNVRLGGDIPSRSVLISLDPGPSDPKLRDATKFKLGDISVWLTRDENKVRVIRALLTLITDWAAHGCPRSTVQHRFAEWAAVVGGVLKHHKIDGFLGNQALVEQHVHYDEHLADFFARWYERYSDNPQGVKKLRATLGKVPEAGDGNVWNGNWPRGRKNELLSWKALGQELREALGQVHGGYQVDVVSDGHGGEMFKVSRVEEPVEEPVGEQKESSQSQL